MSLDIHFLNVGCGDCTIFHFPYRTRSDGKEKNERIMMVDIYNHEYHENYENVIKYYKANFIDVNGTVKSVFRFVCTHPHQDHICGLKKLFDDNNIDIINFWDLNHSFEPEDFESHPTHEDDWRAYKIYGGSKSPAKVIHTKRENTPTLYWNDDEDRISILSPSNNLIRYAHYKEDGTKREKHKIEIDEMSYTLMIRVNDRKIILASDGHKTPCWNDIFKNCKDEIINCTILKAGHHGHQASFHEDAVRLMNPQIIVFSNSKDEDEENGAANLYQNVLPYAQIYKTWRDGTIIIKCPYKSEEEIEVITSY